MQTSNVINTFKKCDMHVHSSSCFSRKYNRQSFFDSVLNSDLDVLAVTDHNNVDSELLLDLYKEMDLRNKILFGGVEINVRLKESTIKAYDLEVGKGNKGKYFHSIIWFPIEYVDKMSSIIKDLFADSIINQTKCETTKDSLLQLSGKEFSKKTDDIAIFLEDFQIKASSIPHFFIPHENKAKSLSDYLPNHSQKNIEYKDRLFYYSHAMAVEGGERSRKSISAPISKELNTTIASLLFSDAQRLSDIGKKFTWIDFDGCLDSLLLAISDPESRIKTSDTNPSLPQTNAMSFLESVTFSLRTPKDETTKIPVELHFAPGYNGIVGSRGSGKSLLACLLANKGLDTYSRLIDIDSVRFITRNGQPTKDRPSCLYIGQGELESIYRNESYETIPFLGEILSPLKQNAEKETKKAKARLETLLKYEKEILISFASKYDAGVKHMDFLNKEAPLGFTLEKPLAPPESMNQIISARDDINEIAESLGNLMLKINTISLETKYPEDMALFEVLNNELQCIRQDTANLSERTKTYYSILNTIKDSWFEKRKALVTLYSDTLNEYNGLSGSAKLNEYNRRINETNGFLDDLLDLRIVLNYLENEVEKAYGKLLTPIEPKELKNNNEPIVVSLRHKDRKSYKSLSSNLLSKTQANSSISLIYAFLCRSGSTEMHKIFNGTKFKGCAKEDLISHYEKYFSLLNESISDSSELSTDISINEERIEEMSPGMKAQALLKLFLNDGIKSGQYMYIVLDQPEDNLDVATIKEFLIDRLKALKLNTQFFIVSHSAPIIVNGDARTVVVCSNQKGLINYSYGPLNEPAIKQSIATVLDGGERYLKMRLNKYNFKVGDPR